MSKKLRVLILEDVPTDAELMIEELAECRHDVCFEACRHEGVLCQCDC